MISSDFLNIGNSGSKALAGGSIQSIPYIKRSLESHNNRKRIWALSALGSIISDGVGNQNLQLNKKYILDFLDEDITKAC